LLCIYCLADIPSCLKRDTQPFTVFLPRSPDKYTTRERFRTSEIASGKSINKFFAIKSF